jgi:hypothetical protein
MSQQSYAGSFWRVCIVNSKTLIVKQNNQDAETIDLVCNLPAGSLAVEIQTMGYLHCPCIRPSKLIIDTSNIHRNAHGNTSHDIRKRRGAVKDMPQFP